MITQGPQPDFKSLALAYSPVRV